MPNNPRSVCDYLNNLVWDRVPRIDRWLIDYAGAADEARTRVVSRAVLIAAVRRARQPGCRFDTMLVLVGPQGCGKSAALRLLAVEDDWFTDEFSLSALARLVPPDSWIVETSELRRLEDLTTLKTFLSRQHDDVRLPHQREVMRIPRRCVLIGTSNEPACLHDTTGNRRFWPVHVQRFDLERLRADRDQLWAEAAEAEALGEGLRLDLPAQELTDAEAATLGETSSLDLPAQEMTDAELFDALHSLFAHDTGDTGIYNEPLRQSVIAELKADRGEDKAGPRLTRFSERFVKPPYTLADMAEFIKWLEEYMELSL